MANGAVTHNVLLGAPDPTKNSKRGGAHYAHARVVHRRATWGGNGDITRVGLVAGAVDAVANGEEGVEPLDEGGVPMEELGDALDDTGSVDAAGRWIGIGRSIRRIGVCIE